MALSRSGPIAFRTSGPSQGVPVVLLHGFLSSSLQWRGTLARCPDLRLIAPDLPGHGLSALPRQPLTPARYTDALEAWADRLRLGAVTLIGHSMGGMVAVDWAARHPSRVLGLGLCAPAGAPHTFVPAPPTWPLRIPGLRQLFVLLLTSRPVARRLFGGILAGGEPDPQTAREFLWSVRRAREAFRSPHFYDYPELGPRLRAIGVPTEVLWGVEDRVLPVADAQVFAAGLADCRLTLLPGCGHVPSIERPAEFDAFLRRIAASVRAAPN